MKVKELLQTWWNQHRADGRRRSRCPDETVLAAFADGYGEGAERTALESHLAECVSCQKQVAFLVRDESREPQNEVPEFLLARAREVVPAPSPALRPLWWAAGAAAAACLIFAVTLQMRVPKLPVALPPHAISPQVQQASPTATTGAAVISGPEVRAATRPARSPDLVRPSEGATVGSAQLEFRWLPLRECLFYELQVTGADGELLWKERTETTHLRLPNAVSLRPGERYFAWVVAHMREGKTVRAKAVSFKVERPGQ